MRRFIVVLTCLFLMSCGNARHRPDSGYLTWDTYGGGPEQRRYSRLDQIRPDNVSRIKVAWQYDTDEEFPGSQIQCNPLVVDDTLYGLSPNGRVFALDAATGEEVWTQRLELDGVPFKGRTLNRGFMHWSDGEDARIYTGIEHLLYALDARIGERIREFGDGGAIDLRENL